MNSFKKYIAFEGIDASGKSTQAQMFCDFLKKTNHNVFCTKEPGGTGISKKIRRILLEDRLNPKARFFLFLADRAIHIETLKSYLKRGYVVSDRCLFSTIAYQSFGEGLELKFIEESNLFATQGLLPDVTFIIDIDLDTMRKRLTKRDVIESKGDEFFKRVIEGYNYIADRFDNVFKIDGRQPAEQVFEDIIGIWNTI